MDTPRFVSEAIAPVPGSMEPAMMASGEPGLPMRFTWRGREYAVAEVLEKWRETGPCRHGSGEQYARKHWFRIKTEDGSEMRLYFERQPASRKRAKTRWFLHSIISPKGNDVS